MERRKHRRLGPLLIRCVFSVRDDAAEGYLVSLSEGGAFLSTGESLVVGETIVVRVTLPWRIGNILSEAEVVYTIPVSGTGPHNSSPGVCIRFVNMSPLDQERIRQYVEKFHELAARLDEGSP